MDLGSERLRRTLSAQVADWIAAEIAESRYAPGDHLSEVDIARRLQVSRSPLREAFRILEKRGLVTLAPHRGARVTLLTPEEIRNLFDIREVLVGLAGRQLALRFTDSIRGELSPVLMRLEEAQGQADQYARASANATNAIARYSGNSNLLHMIEAFADQIGRYARLGLANEVRRRRSIVLWRSAFSAFRKNDGQRAEMLLRRLASENRDAVIRALFDGHGGGSASGSNPEHQGGSGASNEMQLLTAGEEVN
jgi:DNA-binding GntR family transcriptional regulator